FDFFDRKTALHHVAVLFGALPRIIVEAGRLFGLCWLGLATKSAIALELFRDSLVHLAGLIDDRQTRGTTGLNPKHQGRHDRKPGHQDGAKNRRDDEKPAAHTLDVLAFDDDQEFLHEVSFTL